MLNHPTWYWAVMVALLWNGALSAETDIVLDQYAPGTNVGSATVSVFLERAQTFPVTIDGYLDSVVVWINTNPSLRGNLLWDVRPLVNGEPIESDLDVLASGMVPIPKVPLAPAIVGTVLDVSSFGIRVHPGDWLAVTMRTDSDAIAWVTHFPGTEGSKFKRLDSLFTGGTDMWEPETFSPDLDHGFATYVRTVPEPGCWPLCWLLLVGLTTRRR